MIGQRWVPDVEKMSKDLTEALKQHLGDTGWENGGKNPIPNSQVVNSIRRSVETLRSLCHRLGLGIVHVPADASSRAHEWVLLGR